MPYAPTVNDTSGQIFGQYQVGAAEAEAKGIVEPARIMAEKRLADERALAAGITQVGKSVGSGIEDMFNTQEQSDYLNASYAEQKKMGVPWSAEDDKKYYGANIGTRRAMVDMGQMQLRESLGERKAESAFGREMSGKYQYRAFEEGIEQQERATIGETQTVIDPVTQQPRGMVKTSPGQGQLLPQQAAPKPPKTMNTQDGIMQWNPQTSDWEYMTDKSTGKRIMPMAQATVDPLTGLPTNAAPRPGATPDATLGAPARPGATPGATPGPSASQPPTLGAPPAQTYPAPPPESIAALRANPRMAAEFDKFYGPGAAGRVLGGR